MNDRNIKTIPESYVGEIDFRVLSWIEEHKNKLDKSFLFFIKKHHGTIPINGEFKSKKGQIYKIGRFLTLVDETSQLASPIIQSKFNNRDARIDWSIYTLIDEESTTLRSFIDGKRLIPFASLYQGTNHPDGMDLSRANIDLLCFFYSDDEKRPKIVVWNGQKAIQESLRSEEVLENEDLTEEEYYQRINYSSFTELVDINFDDFLDKLN
ncbi:hypothetical protein [Aquimarina sp. 2201CG5-10]|uniref:hypothetical protein n=1 Tax=Aquimarina callyspongiae TaxID=3098150 RepID=UPI002AB3E240|nr:hypothetical protein [Aquimarina sp. 2201CG5-10]MDY8135399.1 hypothetical protein [Aquimarina sp. 2201CG5-10]